MPRIRDPIWEYLVKEGGKIRCKFCNELFTASITRMKYHLSKTPQKEVRMCPVVPDSVCNLALNAIKESELKKRKTTEIQGHSSSGLISSFACALTPLDNTQQTIHNFTRKKEKEFADFSVVKYIVANNLSFNLLRTPEFHQMCKAIASHGAGYIPPSSETARTKILASLKGETDEYIKMVKESWVTSGCTLMSDSWTDARKRPHINLLASCPKGTIFLKSECTVGKKKDAKYIANFISSGIEEIGPENVVQFISDNASNYTSAGFIIETKFPNIFKTACAAHCLDLMLEDIDELPDVKPILATARKMVKFFYKFQHVLDLMRSHTNGRELKRLGATRFATQFLCLQSILKEEQSLRFMIASAEWRLLPQSKTEEGKEVTDTIQGNTFWMTGREIVSTVEPLVRVLRMVDGEGSTMGYIYEGMDRVKEAIKDLHKSVDKYKPFWDIINKRWNNTLHNPLHAVAAYLNPQLFYKKLVKLDSEVKLGLEKVKEKLILSSEDGKKNLTKELRLYHQKDPIIFSELAIDSLQDSHPRVWWDMWGVDMPILRSLAIRLHSQPCSASACERNWSAFEAAHTKKRNRLEPKKLHDLVFIRMNMHFKKTCATKEKNDSEPINLDDIVAFPDLPPREDDVKDEDDLEDENSDEVADEDVDEDANNNAIDFDDFEQLMNPNLN